jgi:hypothetical protein
MPAEPPKVVVVPDQRPLHERVRVIARRYDAIAAGQRKEAATSIQQAQNAERDAKVLHEAARELEGRK